MSDIIKMMAGFMAILLVGLAGVTVSEMMKLGQLNGVIVTVDNIARTR